MFEVERKYRVRRRDFATIQAELFKRLLPAVPLLQEDRYLRTSDPRLTVRVRCQKSYSGVIYLRTEKRKCPIGANTNEENECQIDKVEYDALLQKQQATAFDVPLMVLKRRIEFDCHHADHAVTICLDQVWGPNSMRLGHLVELETMVIEPNKIAIAHKALQSLAAEVLPSSRTREKRGYRTMVMEVLERQARRRR